MNKQKTILSLLVMTGLMFMMIGGVSATHSSSVEVSPSGWLTLGSVDLEFTVENTGGDSIMTVIVQKPGDFSGISCEELSGWDVTESSTSCIFDANAGEDIETGESQTFSVTSESTDFGDYNWSVKTSDGVSQVTNLVPVTVQTIQNAINEDTTGTVTVPAGVYEEDVTINKDITLTSVDGPGSTTINGQDTGYSGAVTVTSDDVILKGFTINAAEHSAILLQTSNDNIEIKDNVLNSATDGKYVILTETEQTNVLFENNTLIGDNVLRMVYVNGDVSIPTSTGSDNVNFINNTFTGTVDNNLVLGTEAENSEIRNNEFSASNIGYAVVELWKDSITVNRNSFLGDESPAVRNDNSFITNATYNWWGVTTYDDIEALTDGDVDFDPWCFDPECTPDTTDPTIEFMNEPYFGLVGEDVVITANVSDDRALSNYTLYFGDDENVTGTFAGEHNMSAIVNETHLYDEEGEYTVELRVQDKTGNIASETTMVVVNAEKPDWMIPLYKDKVNMISIPFVPESTDYQEVLEGVKCNIDKVWSYQYDESTDENKWIYKTVSSSCGWSSGSLQEITPGYGYIVFMKDDDVLYGNARGGVTRDDPESESSEIPWMPVIKLSNRGYNLVGIFGYEDANKSLESLESTEGYKLYKSILDGNLKSVSEDDLESGKSYWLSMTEPYNSNLDYYEYKL